MSKVSEKQRQEWVENPVTLELVELVQKELINIVSTPSASCLHYGDPYKTHDNLVQQDVKAHTFATIRLALEGDWEYFDEE